MKRAIILALATTLCASNVALTACGGSSSGGNGGSDQVTQADSVARDGFVGTWKPVYMEIDGVCYAGDFSGTGESYTFGADGTGSMSVAGESCSLTWKPVDDEHVEMTIEESGTQTLRYDQEHGALYMDEDPDNPGVVALKIDGVNDGSFGLRLDDAVPVKTASDVVGSWPIYGMSISGTMFYGEPDKLSGTLDNMDEYALTIREDGSASLGGVDGWQAVEQDGGVALVKDEQVAPLKELDNFLLLELGEGDGGLTTIYRR